MADALAGLYVHVPFCRTRCAYCDFYSVTDTTLVDAYLDGVLHEVRRYASAFGVFDTIYIGGGTPSVLRGEDVARLLDGVRAEITLDDDAEITIEANPDDVSPSLIGAWFASGINRVSVGAQSFDDDVLRVLGRRHTARDTLRALDALRGAGLQNLAVDLIYGVYGGLEKTWEADVDAVMAFTPEHLSAYQLTIEPHTPLGIQCASGDFLALSEEQERAFFLHCARAIRSRGYEHYEISNFARTSSKRSRHNSKYWCHAPYLGVGPSAHSFRNRRRWWNVRDLSDYVRRAGDCGDAVQEAETLTEKQIRLETLFLGLRTANGVAAGFLQRLGRGREVADNLVDEGVARWCDDRLVPTLAGYLIADALSARFEF